MQDSTPLRLANSNNPASTLDVQENAAGKKEEKSNIQDSTPLRLGNVNKPASALVAQVNAAGIEGKCNEKESTPLKDVSNSAKTHPAKVKKKRHGKRHACLAKRCDSVLSSWGDARHHMESCEKGVPELWKSMKHKSLEKASSGKVPMMHDPCLCTNAICSINLRKLLTSCRFLLRQS